VPDAEDLRIMREQVALEGDGDIIHAYASEHADSFAGSRFVNSRPGDAEPVRFEVFFTDRLDDHERALRARLEHPDRFCVSGARHSRAETESVRPAIEQEVFGWTRGRVHGAAVGLGIGYVHVSIYARGTPGEEEAERFLDRLRDRYGDLVEADIDVPRQLGA